MMPLDGVRDGGTTGGGGIFRVDIGAVETFDDTEADEPFVWRGEMPGVGCGEGPLRDGCRM